MKIRGYFDGRFDPPAPFIRAMVKAQTLKLTKPIRLHIDTGASVTTILDRDVRFLRIDVNTLGRSVRKIGGLGGLIDTYVLEDSVLLFMSEDGEVIEEPLRMYIGKHDLSRLSFEERRLIMQLPSLLGRDLIYRYRLVCDRSMNEVYLER